METREGGMKLLKTLTATFTLRSLQHFILSLNFFIPHYYFNSMIFCRLHSHNYKLNSISSFYPWFAFPSPFHMFFLRLNSS